MLILTSVHGLLLECIGSVVHLSTFLIVGQFDAYEDKDEGARNVLPKSEERSVEGPSGTRTPLSPPVIPGFEVIVNPDDEGYQPLLLTYPTPGMDGASRDDSDSPGQFQTLNYRRVQCNVCYGMSKYPSSGTVCHMLSLL